jgi:hypothetical protein
VIAIGKTTQEHILDLAFDKSDEFLIAACNHEINFITPSRGILDIKKGHGWA